MDPDRERVVAIVKWPAVCLLIVGVLQILAQAASFLLSGPINDWIAQRMSEGGFPIDESQLDPTAPFNLVMGVVALLVSIGTLVGGWAMLQRSSWGLALAGVICAILPCSSCCCINLPVGIWALVVLLKPEVKELMRGPRRPTPAS